MMVAATAPAHAEDAPVVHEHRPPKKADFEGKTIKRIDCRAVNIWRLYFTDGTSFAIQAEVFYGAGLAEMEICEVCALPPARRSAIKEG